MPTLGSGDIIFLALKIAFRPLLYTDLMQLLNVPFLSMAKPRYVTSFTVSVHLPSNISISSVLLVVIQMSSGH